MEIPINIYYLPMRNWNRDWDNGFAVALTFTTYLWGIETN